MQMNPKSSVPMWRTIGANTPNIPDEATSRDEALYSSTIDTMTSNMYTPHIYGSPLPTGLRSSTPSGTDWGCVAFTSLSA